MSERVEGQIWIDKNLPYKLKYHTRGEDFIVETSSSYTFSYNEKYSSYSVGDTILPAGMLVKLNNTGEVEEASFPDDLENVLGILSTDVKKTGPASISNAIVSRSGYLTIDEPWKIFKEFESLKNSSTEDEYKKNLPAEYDTMIGKPIYWYIGKVEVTGSGDSAVGTYKYDKNSDAGKLTFNTPVGFEWNSTLDSSINVSYDNLPQVGTLVKIEKEKVYLHLNFSKFSSTINWSWPGVHDKENSTCGLIETTQTKDAQDDSKEIFIRHGLFADSDNKHNVRSFCDIVALKNHESEDKEDETIREEYLVQAPVINKTTGSDRYTKITISSAEDFYYRISGRINYKFDKGGN